MSNFFSKFLIAAPSFATRIVIVALVGLLTFSAYKYGLLFEQNRELVDQVAKLEEIKANLNENLMLARGESSNLSLILQTKEEDLALVAEKVDYFEKLKEVDPELLKKYSKISFLNENYVPQKLVAINPEYLTSTDKSIEIHTNVLPYLQKLITEAKKDGIGLQIVSGYRSFGTQSSLKSSYRVVYGAGTANQFSADQGYSEHQLGTTVDFTTASSSTIFAGFEKTLAYNWLNNNAYKYGFVLSYPPNNKYYQFEPWHWRFVGVKLATRLRELGLYFYDYDQRDIDAYRGSLFD